jgi:hypothetical protein
VKQGKEKESAKINNSEIDSKTFSNYFVRFAQKQSVVKPVYKKGDKMTWPIIDQFCCCPHSQR